MQTSFSSDQLADPTTAESAGIVRKCVHCGFCTATCPTYVLLGDELDSPRGRIYLIKDMLEHPERPVTDSHVRHVDRCLSCLSCMTTCPSGVHFMHLVDHARSHIEQNYRRPFLERLLRALLGWVLPSPFRFRLALIASMPLRRLGRFIPGRVGAMLRLAPPAPHPPSASERPQIFAADGVRRGRVALLAGCVQNALAPSINEATIRLLTRHGIEVVIAEGAGCCGALNLHLGQEAAARAWARRNIAAWRALEADAILINASGCGTMVKDYGHLLREDPAFAADAARISERARDISEYLAGIELGPSCITTGERVAYHSACSLQHGQGVREQPKQLLQRMGFDVLDVPEGHLCCGSAGSYNLLQPEIARALRDRKLAAIASTGAALVAAGNIGCITQLGSAGERPVLHTVELLDWATGGPRPPSLP
jgi:glycolate oxidase iron-sulfur subunit